MTDIDEQEETTEEQWFDARFEFREYDTYDLGTDADLDKYALDIEASNQSHYYQKWSELLMQAQAKLSKQKEVLANIEADLFIRAKVDGIPGAPKPSDPTAKAWVLTQKRHKRATAKKRIAENNVAYLQNALKVLEHKRTMIKVEADLWITGYYARPHINAEAKAELDEQNRLRHSEQLKTSLKKRHLRQGD